MATVTAVSSYPTPYLSNEQSQPPRVQTALPLSPKAHVATSFGWTPKQTVRLAEAVTPVHRLVMAMSMAIENMVHLLTAVVKGLQHSLGWFKNTSQQFDGQASVTLPSGYTAEKHATSIGSMLVGHSLASQLEQSTAGAFAFPQLRRALSKLAKGTPEATPNLPASVLTLATHDAHLADTAITLLHQTTGSKHPIQTLDIGEVTSADAFKEQLANLSAKVAEHNPDYEPGVVVLRNVGLTKQPSDNPDLPAIYDTLNNLLQAKGDDQERLFEAYGLKLPNQLLVTHLETAPPLHLTGENLALLPERDLALYQWHNQLTQSPFELNALSDAVLPLPLPLPVAMPAQWREKMT